MIVGRVIGTVVSTQKDPRMEGVKLQVVQPFSIADMKPDGKPLVAVDTVGAGLGEIVMVCAGSSARQTSRTNNTPTDASIMAIIDTIDVQDNVVYSKHDEE